MDPITDTDQLARICARFAKSDFVTVDTEFIRETTFWPRLCLIQIAIPGDQAIVDPLAEGIELGPFFELMADHSVVKVFHAARQDIEIIHHLADVIPAPLFDTQVAAMVCGFGDSVGYEHLVRKLTGAHVDKASRFTDWARRPLTDKQLKYAMSDVTHLRDIYAKLKEKLETSGRASWLAEEMAVLESPATYQLHPEDAWKRLKFKGRGKRALAVLMEVAEWREREAQTQNVPRNRIVKDDTLSEIALNVPETREDLGRLRSIPRGFERSARAATLMEAVDRGRERDLATLPEIQQPAPPQAKANGLIDLLKVALKSASERHGVAQRLIATVPDLEKIAADDNADVAALHGWRLELFGNDALAIKRGERCFLVQNGHVVIREVPTDVAAPKKRASG